MSGKGFSEYIKAPRIREILQREDKDCEEKLASINLLLDNNGEKKSGGDQGESSGNGLRAMEPSAVGGNSSSEEVDRSSGNGRYDNIVENLKGIDRKLAINLLEIIEQNKKLSWDSGNYEIIVNDEQIQFSDIRQLIKKIVMVAGMTLPVGITLFIEELIRLKVPLSLFRSGDSIQIRSNLLKILGIGNEDTLNSEETVPKETVEDPSRDFKPKQGVKRKREIDLEFVDDNDVVEKKKKHESDVEESFDQPPDKLKGIRRTPILKKNIEKVWNLRNNKASEKKNNGRKK